MASGDRDELALVPALARWTFVDGNSSRHPESHYLDFVINGQSVSSMAADAGLDEMATPLNRPWLESVPDEVDRFLGRQTHPELAAGRVAILVCAVCGDLGCGAVTAHLAVTDTTVTWSAWAVEDNRAPAQRSMLSGHRRCSGGAATSRCSVPPTPA